MTREFDQSRATVGPLSYLRTSQRPLQEDESLSYNMPIIKDLSNKIAAKVELPPPQTPDDDEEEWFDKEFKALTNNKEIISARIEKLREGKKTDFVNADDDDINPIVLMYSMDKKYSDDWREWEPETIISTAEKDGIEISRVNQDKLMAVRGIAKTPDFFDSARVFEKVCVAFSNKIVDWSRIQEVRVHDIAATVALIQRYVLDIDFSDDVASYVAACAIRDGYLILPEHLTFAQNQFSELLSRKKIDVNREEILKKIKEEKNLTPEEGVQLMRYVRCVQHVADKMSEINK